MADNDFHGDIWQAKYFALLTRCKQIEGENGKIVNRIIHCKRYTKRLEKERRFLKRKLDEHGDDYHKAQPPYQVKLLEELEIADQFEKSGLVPVLEQPQSPIVGGKKGKSKVVSKQDKEKDPNAPKRPANAFFMFCQQQRTAMQEDQKDATMGHHELTKFLAKEWNNLLPEEKQAYYKMYEQDKTRYEQEMKQYAQDKGSAGSTKKESSKKTKSSGSKATTSKSKELLPTPEALVANADPALQQVLSPTLNALSPQSLSNVPFSIQHLSSPSLTNPETVFSDMSVITSLGVNSAKDHSDSFVI